MNQKALYVWRGGKHLGPISVNDVRKGLETDELAYTDYVWLNDQNAWTMLANFFADEFPPPREYPRALADRKKPQKPILKKFENKTFEGGAGISNEPIWFLYRNKQKHGPYRFLEVVQLLQTNECSKEDFVWKPGMDDWQRVNQVYEFDEEILKKLKGLKKDASFGLDKVFVRRRFPRVPYDGEVIIHDNNTVLLGEASSLSEGGAFVRVKTPSHKKGDRLKLHFTPSGVKVPFNCIAEIIQVSKSKNPGYAVKFIYIEKDDRERVAEFTNTLSRSKAVS